ncbi:hypothetical protein [Nostoc sp. LEGE 06077]|uniref:hypothetical protein n=1 Tax=Nostoc sp. LEGE 06077 TaxID=915325 RepID=UPI001D14763D|nr:hypothetical protein [Nostoc sp. LEGE 06077]
MVGIIQKLEQMNINNRLLSRREALGLFRADGTAILVVGCMPKKSISPQQQAGLATPVSSTTNSANLPGCVVSPQQTEGPYFVNENMNLHRNYILMMQ